MKKAYVATNMYDDENRALVVFGATAQEAKKQAYGNDYFDDYTNIRVNRMPSADKFASENTKQLSLENIEHLKFLRKEGWYMEDDRHICANCGLYVFEDLPESHLDDNEICGECREDV